jgi:hypothetical protein
LRPEASLRDLAESVTQCLIATVRTSGRTTARALYRSATNLSTSPRGRCASSMLPPIDSGIGVDSQHAPCLPRGESMASSSVPGGMAARSATPPSRAAARRQQRPQVSSCGREPPEVLIDALPLLLERAKNLVKSPPRILHAPSLMEDWVAKLYSLMSSKKTVRVGACVRHRRRVPRAEAGSGCTIRREQRPLRMEVSGVCLDRGRGS